MLENAVHPQMELRAVKTQANQHKTQSGVDLTYKQYSNLLLSAASQFDAQFTAKSYNTRAAAKRRSVYEHDIYQEPQDAEGDTFYDIDSDVETIQAFNSVTNKPQGTYTPYPRLTSNQWHRLSPNAQQNWDKFSNAEKGVILEERSPPAPNRPQQNRFSRPPTPCSSNLHEITAFDFLQANLHGLCMGSNDEGTMTHDDVAGTLPDNQERQDSDTELLAHVTKQSNISPGDLQRVLSNSMAKYTGKKGVPGKPTDKDGEITVSSKKYRQVNMAKLAYIASAHHGKYTGALVDQGADGGIAGEDVCIINKTGRHVDVQGIDNHQIVDIPIVTAGAVIPTQRGEVIGIFHQYAYTGKGKSIPSSLQFESFKNDVNDKSIKVSGAFRGSKQ